MHEQIHDYFSEKTKSDEAGCVVAVVKNGEVIHRAGYGLANMEWGIPNSPETVFRLASITKQFTAMAIMMLMEEGKLSLDDPITKFFPDFSTSGHHVTVTHLLNHTSGIKSNTSLPDFEKTMRNKYTPQEMYETFAHQPFDFAPSEKWSYNNSGYHLLGMIIEKLSGQSYEDFLKSHIFEPLEMKTACYLHNEIITPKRATGYFVHEGKLFNSGFIDMSVPFSAGSLGASVDDLIKWNKALRENRLISAENLQKMHQPTKLNDGKIEDYGFGWSINTYQGHRIVRHDGGINGFRTNMFHLFEDDLLVIVLCNNTSLNHEMLSLAALRRVLNLPDPSYTEVKLSPEQLACVEGAFQKEDFTVHFEIVEGELNSPEFVFSSPFRPYSETEFYSTKNSDVTLVFEDNFSTATLKLPFNNFVHKRVQGE
jgi:CubicO group peptidase (beta-lactamase class C family)